jgi:ferric-dicitrate binding protein FerR (iron transport regulator)
VSHIRPVDLADLLRGRLSPKKASQARQHLDGCADCRAAFARVRASNEAFDTLLESPLPEVGVIRGEATVRWTRLPETRRVRTPFLVFAGMSLAAAGLLFFWNPAPARDSGPNLMHIAKRQVHETPLEAGVTLLGGVVNVTHGETLSRLDPSMHLSRGDKLNASEDARVAAQWAEGSGFLLLADSEMAIEKLAAQEIRLALERGKIDVRRGPHGPDDALQVIAPAHTIRARGTWFTVAAAHYETTVEVLEGMVEVTDRESGVTTTLNAPTRAVFGRGKTTQTPIPAREAAALRTASEMNLLAPASLAKNALMTVSSDPAGTLAVDGVELGPTPMIARQPLGRHYIEIARHGFQPLRRWMVLGQEPGQLHLALVKSEVPSEPQSVPVEIESMIRARATKIRSCYEHSLKRDPSLAGTVSLRLKVGDVGQVQKVSVDESTLADPSVAECLRKEAMGWSFQKGRNATVVYPFVFRAQ